LSRKRTDMVSSKWKNYFMNTFFKGSWGKRRELPEFKIESFSKLWKSKNAK
jgi:L-lactate dehydrogenase complex protein LldF